MRPTMRKLIYCQLLHCRDYWLTGKEWGMGNGEGAGTKISFVMTCYKGNAESEDTVTNALFIL